MFPKDAPRTVRFGRGMAVYDRATHAAQRTSIRPRLQADGSIEAQVPVMETGTGSHTMIRRVVAEGLDLPSTTSSSAMGTAHLPYDSGVGGSRVTVSASEAAHLGVLEFREALQQEMARALGVPVHQVELRASGVGADAEWPHLEPCCARGPRRHGRDGERHGRGPGGAQGRARGSGDQLLCADRSGWRGRGDRAGIRVRSSERPRRCGDSGAHQSPQPDRRWGGDGHRLRLTGDLGIEEGQVSAAHLGDYKMSNIADTAGMRVELLRAEGVGTLNVKGIGELPNVPTAAAIANAVADAVGVRIDTLPITAESPAGPSAP